MKKTVGRTDAIIRILLAILLAVLIYTDTITGTLAIVSGIVGAILLITGLTGFCAIYSIIGIKTCPDPKAD